MTFESLQRTVHACSTGPVNVTTRSDGYACDSQTAPQFITESVEVQVFWISPQGTVRNANWYGDRNPAWSQFQLPGQAAPGAITCLSRKPEHMEVSLCPALGTQQPLLNF